MKIAVFGATSQVASSAALYLKVNGLADVTAFARSDYAAPFYSLFGIPYQNAARIPRAELADRLSEFEAVADFSIPKLEFWENPVALRAHLDSLLTMMKRGTIFLGISSQNAFGFGPDDRFVRNYRIPRGGTYGALKRIGERLSIRIGRARDLQVYNLRLGQIHGFLQSAHVYYCGVVASNPRPAVTGDAADLTNTAFACDVADALLQCMRSEHRPGTYSVLSNPQWTQEQFYGYYAAWMGLQVTPVFLGHSPRPAMPSVFRSRLMALADRNRGILDVAILSRLPALAVRLKGDHRLRAARGEKIAGHGDVERNLLGVPPLPVLGLRNASPDVVLSMEKRMAADYENIIRAARHGKGGQEFPQPEVSIVSGD